MRNSFGRKFKQLREAKSMSQWELSRKLGYATNSYISTIEKGAFIPSEEKLKDLARAMNVPFHVINEFALEARLEDFGIKEPFISMFKDYPQLTRKDRQAIIKAYLEVKTQQGKHDKQPHQKSR